MGIMTLDEAKNHANKKEYGLSAKAERVIEALKKTGGKCPCVSTNPPECPCPAHVLDIIEAGRCHCNLFVRKA